jgi:hypothetical protein
MKNVSEELLWYCRFGYIGWGGHQYQLGDHSQSNVLSFVATQGGLRSWRWGTFFCDVTCSFFIISYCEVASHWCHVMKKAYELAYTNVKKFCCLSRLKMVIHMSYGVQVKMAHYDSMTWERVCHVLRMVLQMTAVEIFLCVEVSKQIFWGREEDWEAKERTDRRTECKSKSQWTRK